MAKFDSAEKLNLADIEITDVMTGDRDKRMFLYYQLIHSLKKGGARRYHCFIPDGIGGKNVAKRAWKCS